MMFSALFLFCLIAGSFACSDDHCKDPKLANELKDVQLMPNEEQLRTLCPKVLSFLECEKSYFECPGQTLEEATTSSDKSYARKAITMSGAMGLVRDLCDEDSSFHRDYVANIDCFRGYIEDGLTLCRQDTVRPLEQFFEQLYTNESDRVPAEIICLSGALEVACVVDKLGESCGADAQRTAITALEWMKALLKTGTCEEVENLTDLKTKLIDFLEIEGDRRSNVQSVFDLFKRRR